MQESIQISKLNNTDLNMYQCGFEICANGHSFGPAVRDHYLIHYIHSGKGIFQVGGKTYNLKKGQGFLICPSIVTFYQADKTDPWQYTWVGFIGLKAELYLSSANLSAYNPVFTYEKDNFINDCFMQMRATKEIYKGRELRLLGLLYLFLSKLIEEFSPANYIIDSESRKEEYVKKVVQYIEMNYSRNITVQEIAHNIGLDRSYLGTVFKSFFGISVQEFLIKFRMDKACELMRNNSLSIGDISRSVGYVDTLLFSKTFKKVKGTPPRIYRKGNGFKTQ